jgi:membrane-bound lytic murein transglycosylase D
LLIINNLNYILLYIKLSILILFLYFFYLSLAIILNYFSLLCSVVVNCAYTLHRQKRFDSVKVIVPPKSVHLKTSKKYYPLVLSLLSTLATAHEAPQSQIQFCHEALPIFENRVVKSFENELRLKNSQPLDELKTKAQRIFKVIEPIIASYNIPADFKYLCVAESALNLDATSRKGAHGLWQFMPETATSLGLIISGKTDDRQNIIKSTHAACHYFRKLYAQLGSWTLVAAAYNVGPTRVKEYMALKGNGDYYTWNINRENRKYLYRVVAIKELFTRPQVYQALFNEKITLQKHLQRDGEILGLVTYSKPVTYVKLASFLAFSDSFISGFETFKSLTFNPKESILFNNWKYITALLNQGVFADSTNIQTDSSVVVINFLRSLFFRKEDIFYIDADKTSRASFTTLLKLSSVSA